MAILNITGFELGPSTFLDGGQSGTCAIQSTTKRTGGYALQCNPTTSATGRMTILTHSATTGALANLTNNTDRYLRFYFNFATAPASSNEQIAVILDATVTTASLEIRLNSDGTLSAYSGTTLLATGATVLSSGTWYRIEIKRLLGTTNAAWELKINGTSEISGTFSPGRSTGNDVRLGKNTDRNSQTIDFFYDDVVLSDSAYPGAGQCSMVVPNAAGNYQTATRGGADSGNNWDQVNELPPNDDTDYLITDNTIDNAETEALQSAATAGVSDTILGVKAFAVIKRDGGSNGAVRLRVRSGSTDSDTSADVAADATYRQVARLLATDPNTSAAWTTGGIDGAEVGIVERSSANKTRMTVCGLMVDWAEPPAGPSGSPYYAYAQQ